MFEKDLEEALTQRVNDIDALINCISQLYLLSELKSEGQNPSIKELGNGKLAGDQNRKMQNQKTQMMDVSQAKTAVSAVEEDLKLLQFKLRALMSSKCNLQAYKKELEIDCNLLMVQKAAKEVECQILKMKLKILDEIYEQRKKVSEEKLRLDQHERQESQRQLSALEEQGKLAAEEVRNYKKRIKEMEKQLQQVERSFQHQVALHEVKAHESWVRAHSLERRMIEATRETAYLKHREDSFWSSRPELTSDPSLEDYVRRRENGVRCPGKREKTPLDYGSLREKENCSQREERLFVTSCLPGPRGNSEDSWEWQVFAESGFPTLD
ncbi:putative nuclear pore complex-interacting protein family member B2 isoform 4-T4 [Dugong dugon]